MKSVSGSEGDISEGTASIYMYPFAKVGGAPWVVYRDDFASDVRPPGGGSARSWTVIQTDCFGRVATAAST